MNKIKEKVRIKKYAKKFIETGGNQTQSYKAINPKVTHKTATVEGCKYLDKPSVQTEIQKLLEDKGLTIDSIVKVHKRNMLQSKQLGVSQSAVDTGYKLYGHLTNNDKQGSTNIAVFIGGRLQDNANDKNTQRGEGKD